ncbi:hypothetical protein T484DRAFT_1867013, partial [Baffinella frigidus]
MLAEAEEETFALKELIHAEAEEETFALKESKHYLLIGRGGEVVRKIEAATNTAICFRTAAAAVMVVRGSVEGRAAAWKMSQDILAEIGEVEQEQYKVGREHHAVLIGANGRQIQKWSGAHVQFQGRTIEKESGARVQFQGDNDLCFITGTTDERAAAWLALSALVDQG